VRRPRRAARRRHRGRRDAIIDFYRKLGKLVVIDGVGDSDDVFARLVAQVDQRVQPLQT
jgi:adenylate kinase family enzyme